MRKLSNIRRTVLILTCVISLFPFLNMAAQHNVSLTWNDSADKSANPTLGYNLYRASGTCAAPTLPWLKINTTPIPGTAFTDSSGVQIGTYCYYATATLNGAESVSSNFASAVILPAAPSNLVATSH